MVRLRTSLAVGRLPITGPMDVPGSVPPPGAPAPVPAAPARVTGLKKLDNRRVIARLIDIAPVAVPAMLVADGLTEELFFLALNLIYFFLCEALFAQTLGKHVMGLRVMTPEGGAPTVNAISVRTVLRLIDDGPIGALVIVLSRDRRQRIGDLLAGTAVGPAAGGVARPAPNALLVVYPVGWLIGAILWVTMAPALPSPKPPPPTARAAEPAPEWMRTEPKTRYERAAERICASSGDPSDMSVQAGVRAWARQRRRHAALRPPRRLRAVHAALVESDALLMRLERRKVRAIRAGDGPGVQELQRELHAAWAERKAAIGGHMNLCA